MENLHRLNIETLIDMLSTQTNTYLQMHIEGATEDEFAKCNLLLKAVQKEIDSRKKINSNALSSHR